MSARGRLLVVVAALSSLVLATPGPAAAAAPPPKSPCHPGATPPAYPPGQCTLQLSTNSVVAGATLVASGCGYGPGTGVALSLVPGRGKVVDFGQATAAPSGCIAATVTVPAKTNPGQYLVRGRGKDAGGLQFELVSDPLTVTQATVALSGQDIAFEAPAPSSSSGTMPLAAAVGLGLLGSFCAVAVRRRQREGGHRGA